MELVRVSDQDLQISYYRIRGRAIRVIRDDCLPHGTKQRGYRFFDRLAMSTRTVVSSAAPTGYGQVALAYMASQANIKVYIFVNYLPEDNWLINQAKSYGATYVVNSRQGLQVVYKDPLTAKTISWEDNYRSGQSTIYQAEQSAREFALKHDLLYLGLGLSDPDYIQALAYAIKSACVNFRDFSTVEYPKRLWLAVGSGTILQALIQVWPRTHFLCVQVGKKIDNLVTQLSDQVTISKFISPLRFDQALASEDQPPYDSLATYDAKIWSFVDEFEDGDFIWNVAGNIPEPIHKSQAPVTKPIRPKSQGSSNQGKAKKFRRRSQKRVSQK